MVRLPEHDELQRNISARSNEELIQILALEQSDYRQEAIEIARDELRRRGQHELSREQYEAEVADSEIAGQIHFPKVPFARRLNADTVDGVIVITLMLVPMFLIEAIAGSLPTGVQRLGVLGIPIAFLYAVLRDAVGGGTSIGKKLLGLRLIDLRTGKPCAAAQVWFRNVTDLVPGLNAVDFLMMCVDVRGQKLMDKKLEVQLVDARVKVNK